MTDLDHLLAVAEAATPGPWITHEMGHIFVGNRADGRTSGLWEIVHVSGDELDDLQPWAADRCRADAAHIATFDPPTVRALIERVKRAEAEVAELRDKAVEQFNKACPVGSPVIFWPGVREGDGSRSRTRSAAWLLGGHTPVVMVDGYAGGIALTHVLTDEERA